MAPAPNITSAKISSRLSIDAIFFVKVDSSFIQKVGNNVGNRLFNFRVLGGKVNKHADYRDQEVW